MIRSYYSSHTGLHQKTDLLRRKMLNSICGFTKEIGFVKRSKFGPRIFTAGAEIAGIHHLLNRPDPGRGAYHIGGAGININEAFIKSFGESIERYAQLTAEFTQQHEFIFSSYLDMQNNYSNVLNHEYLDLYTSTQLKKQTFPFTFFNQERPLSWVRAKSLLSGEDHYVPAQFVFVGYQIKRDQDEPWYAPAVTTGTAAHTDLTAALLGALLEIIQIDSTIGHWYTDYQIPEILFDERTKPLESLLHQYGNSHHNPARFFWLKNPDLAGISIACLLEKSERSFPKVAIGLGASTTLNDAMYKAYLEAIGVANLSTLLILKDTLQHDSEHDNSNVEIYNIDSNVALYGRGYHHAVIDKKFNARNTVYASEISSDLTGTKAQQLMTLVSSFAESGKDLLLFDLTNTEAKELGFFVPRLWSKDTLSLCLPSAPPTKHPRFKAYGGFKHDTPHPYP